VNHHFFANVYVGLLCLSVLKFLFNVVCSILSLVLTFSCMFDYNFLSCVEFVILVTLNKLYAVVVNNFFISTSFIWFDLPLICICTIHF
jgi:hypothetical protein